MKHFPGGGFICASYCRIRGSALCILKNYQYICTSIIESIFLQNT